MGELTLHHLQLSQSERIVWLLAELRLPHKLITYQRHPITAGAPDSLKALHPARTAPVFVDTTVDPPVTLSESGGIVEYILAAHGSKSPVKLTKSPGEPGYADYVEWLHVANGSLFPAISRVLVMQSLPGAAESPLWGYAHGRMETALANMDAQLGRHKYLAGEELTAADVMTVYSLTTIRGSVPAIDLKGRKNILRYLRDVGAREGYREAMRKGDPQLRPCLEETLDEDQRKTFRFAKI